MCKFARKKLKIIKRGVNMKIRKKQFAFALILICILALAGCQKKEDAISVLTKAQENAKKVENVSATGTMNMKMSSNEQSVDMNTEMNMVVFTNPYKAKINMSLDLGDLGKQDSELYLMSDNNSYATYTKIDGEWYKQSIDKEIFEQTINGYNNSAYTDALLECKDKLQFEETKEDGKSYYKVEGTITGDAMKKLIDSTNLKDQLSATGTDVSVYDNLGDLKIVSFIEKDSYHVYKISLDMKDMMNKMLKETTKDSGNESQKISIDNCTMNITYTGYNNAENFELPKEAKDAQELQQ